MVQLCRDAELALPAEYRVITRKQGTDGSNGFNVTLSRVPAVRPEGNTADESAPEHRSLLGVIFHDR